MHFSSVVVFLSALVALVHGYANPLACSGTCTNTHDPSLIRRASDGTYWRFATGGTIAIFKATSLQGPWVSQGQMLSADSIINNSGNNDLWAPDVHLIGSTYYCYYAVSAFGTQVSSIGLATSATMEVGSWTDHGAILSSVTGDQYNAIDANLIPVGSSYLLNFGSFWEDIFQSTMSSPTAASGTPYNIAYNSSGTHPSESSYMIKEGSYYYLFFSSGICCNYDVTKPPAGSEYKVMVCRSTTATGGFVDKNGVACTNGGGSLVLPSHGVVYGPGGQGLYNDPTDGWVMYYHYVNTTIGYADADKLLGVNKVDFSTGWPVV